MKRIIWIVLLFAIAGLSLAQELPTVQELGVDSELAEINSTFETLPDQIDQEMIPTETATQLFAYMKWLFHPETVQELVGETLAPLFLELYALLVMLISFLMLWLLIRMLVLSWRLFLFIVEWIIKLLELIPIFQ